MGWVNIKGNCEHCGKNYHKVVRLKKTQEAVKCPHCNKNSKNWR